MTQKQTVYLPTVSISSMFVIEEGRIYDNVEEEQGYLFTPEQLNEYTANVIKKALETAAEKAEIQYVSEWSDELEVNKQSIKDTFDQTYKEFEV